MNRIWSSFKNHPYLINVLGYTTLFTTADLIQQCVLGKNRESSALHNVATPCSHKQDAKKFEDREENQNDVALDMRVKQEAVYIEPPHEWVESEGSGRDKITTANVGEIVPSSEMKTKAWLGVNWLQTARVALVGFCFHANFNYNWLKALERIMPGGGIRRVSGKVLMDQLIAAPVTISAFYVGLSALEGREDLFEDWQEKFWTSYKTGVVYWSTMQAVNFSLVPPVARTAFVGGISLGWTVFLCHFRQQRG